MDPLKGTTNTTINAVKQATQYLEECLKRDEEYPELWDFFGQTSSGQYSSGDAINIPQFSHKKWIVLPEALIEQYNYLECKSFMGLLPEINRAWITIDNRLFLWNYEDGRDFQVYDGLDQIIVSAGLAKPKKNIFQDIDIKHVLVLATPVEVVMLAIYLQPGSNELTLHPTKFALPSDNVNMLKIVGTDNGRIFMCGRDGCLYELDYQADDRAWFGRRRKCRKLNHSAGKFSSLVPSFLKLGSDDALIDIITDNSRNILYTLSERSVIQVFDLGEDGKSISKIATASHIAQEAIKMCPRVQNWDAQMFSIIAAAPVTTSESGPVHLVCITQGGLRLYFCTNSSRVNSRLTYYKKTRPDGLYLVHVRFPPSAKQAMNAPTANGHTTTTTDQSQPTGANIHNAFYSQGVLLMADAKTPTSDIILNIGPDAIDALKSRGNYVNSLVEKANSIEIEGRTWAISELPPAAIFNSSTLLSSLKSSSTDGRPIELVMRNELAIQHMLPPRQFLCLTSSGLHLIMKYRPVDILREVLGGSRGADTPDVRTFFLNYGPDQACAMCLILACNEAANSGVNFSAASPAKSSDLINWATQVFFRLGGVPFFDNPNNFPLNTEDAKQRYMRYSASHDGLALYLSRLLRPVWFQPLLDKKKSASHDPNANPFGNQMNDNTGFVTFSKEEYGDFISRLTKQQLIELEVYLTQLKSFLDKNPQFAMLRAPDAGAKLKVLEVQKLEEEAKRIEQNSLSNLHFTLLRSLESLALLSILNDFLPDSYLKLPSSLINKITSMKFRDLVSSEEGFQVVKSLVEALIQDARVDSISQILAARCPSFFSEADRTRYQGFELMTKAKYAERFDEKESYLRASLELFKKIPDHLNRQDVLQAITEEYQYLRYYEGAVILALECANAADPSGAGFTWFQEGMSDKDERGKTAYQKRIKTYSNIIRVLDELHTGAFTGLVTDRSVPRPTLDTTELENEKLKVIKACRKSTDELFHIVLYKWYLSQSLDNELLQLQTPYLEVFLRKYSENKTQSMDLLWKYYVRQKKYAAAAVILAKLAETKEPAKLEIRIENLARAITNAKSAMDQHQLSNQVDGELLHDLEEKMEVARIQLKIYNDLQQIADLKLRDQARAELDTQLYTVSELYNRYVKNYGLCESALAIIHVSRHNDPILIKKLWENIIADELNQVQHEYKIAPLVNKLLDLGRAYSSSEITFPVEFLVEILERKSIELKRQWERSRNSFDISWVVNTMLDIGIPHHRLFFAYNDDLLEKTDPFWKDPANQFHLIDVLCVLLDRWIKHVRSASVSAWDIKQFRSKHVDTGIEKLVTRLHALKIGDAKADQLSSKLRTLKKEVLDFKPNPYTLTPMRQF